MRSLPVRATVASVPRAGRPATQPAGGHALGLARSLTCLMEQVRQMTRMRIDTTGYGDQERPFSMAAGRE